MTTITPAEAQRHVDRAFVLNTLAEIHTTWGEAAWNNGRIREAVAHWQAAARYSLDAKRSS